MKRILSALVALLYVASLIVPPSIYAQEDLTAVPTLEVTAEASETTPVEAETPDITVTPEPTVISTEMPTEIPVAPTAVPTEVVTSIPTEVVTPLPIETPTELPADTLTPDVSTPAPAPTDALVTSTPTPTPTQEESTVTPDSTPTVTPKTSTTMATGPITVTVSPSIVSSGDIVRVTGTGFEPGERVSITWPDSSLLGAVTASTEGVATGRITIPSVAPIDENPNGFAIHMTGRTSGLTNYGVVVFASSIPKDMHLSPSSGLPGTRVAVTGSGFAPGERVDIMWSSGKLVGYLYASSTGTVSGAFLVPSDAGGSTYELVSLQSTSGTVSDVFYITAPPRAIIKLSQTEGAAGDIISVYGSNYRPGEVVTITWPGGKVLGRVTARTDGSFSGRISIPSNAYAGAYTITARGDSSGYAAGARFYSTSLVMATVRLSATMGTGGSVVRFSGSGYQPGERVQVIFDFDRTLGTVWAAADGSISGAVTIPTWSYAGSHYFDFNGLTSGQYASADYYVTKPLPPKVSVTPYLTTGGTVVTVSGSGFRPGEPVLIAWNDAYGPTMGFVTATSNGTMSGRVTIPKWALRGSYRIHATGQHSGLTNSAAVSVTQSPVATVTLSPTSGNRLSTVRLTGSGFGSYEQVVITMGSSTTAVGWGYTTDRGTFSASITIPSSAAIGSVRIYAQGSTSKQRGSAVFTVTSTSTPTNPYLPPTTQCDPSYPDFCIPPRSLVGDLDCGSSLLNGRKRFTVYQPDPHNFDADNDGIGCES